MLNFGLQRGCPRLLKRGRVSSYSRLTRTRKYHFFPFFFLYVDTSNLFEMAPLVFLITGCTSGFGEAFVHDALSRGDKVIATGRKSETRLVHLKEAGASILELDVTASPAELDAKVKEAIAIYGHIDVLVNNAGYVQTGLIEATTYVAYFIETSMEIINTPFSVRRS